MKTYEIELKRVSFVTLTIEAEDQDAAEALAWEQIQRDYYRDDGDWDIAEVSEVRDGVTYHEIATDETRSNGA
jgi:hypothetical protein